MLKLAVLFLCWQCTLCILSTDGPFIVDADSGTRINLKCVNWYGAHQELFSVGGLEVQSIENISRQIVLMGANCVRIPFSVELTRDNPTVGNITALELLDNVVNQLTDDGLMVIMNNHVSQAGWVGAAASNQQGLWHMPGYPTIDWIESLRNICARYRNNSLVVAMDIRNEIHDQDNTIITWGDSNDTESDWLAASTLADSVIAAEAPDKLIIVSALCWGIDMRRLAQNPGPKSALRRNKLVFTTHIYKFSFWWMQLPDYIMLLLTAVTIVCWIMAFLLYRHANSATAYGLISHHEWKWNLRIAGMFPFFMGWLVVSFLFLRINARNGCTSVGDDALPVVMLSAVCCVISIGYLQLEKSYVLAALAMLWMGVWALSVMVVLATLQLPQAYYSFFSLWRLNNLHVPVFVGEIGTIPGDKSALWKLIWG